MTQVNPEALSVSQLNEYIRTLMDADEFLGEVCVRGEISNFKNHYATGHLYFSLKDDKSVIRCVMFSSYASKLKFKPDNGMKVVIFGRVSVFPRDGSYQIYSAYMMPDGMGELYIAFEQLKEKLSAEGLFDEARKKKIPKYPQAIGLVTSASGAAVRDLCNVLGRRFPSCEILIYPALVQGAGAAESIIRGIRYFNDTKCVDTVIIGRGGGSVEDLWCFNDEKLARTIAASEIPLISAVGHEVDFTISDFVADLRAPTPSAAAELAVPDSAVLLRQLGNVEAHCRDILGKSIDRYAERLRYLSTSGVLSSPLKSLEMRESNLIWLSEKLDNSYKSGLSRAERNFVSLCGRLEGMNPLAVLARGYAAVSREENDTETIVTDATSLREGDVIRIRFRDGDARASVLGTTPEKPDR